MRSLANGHQSALVMEPCQAQSCLTGGGVPECRMHYFCWLHVYVCVCVGGGVKRYTASYLHLTFSVSLPSVTLYHYHWCCMSITAQCDTSTHSTPFSWISCLSLLPTLHHVWTYIWIMVMRSQLHSISVLSCPLRWKSHQPLSQIADQTTAFILKNVLKRGQS